MDPDYPAGKSPRRELQGPRPAPLKVRKDSHKIKKPPVAPPQPSQQPPQHRPPVIIYTVSPKVIHTDPSEFMTLVQRLTGSSNISSSSTSYTTTDSAELLSPAARFAAVEKTKSPKQKNTQQGNSDDVAMVDEEMETGFERTSLFPGILSPGPAALPPIPTNFFSPPSYPNPLSFFHDLSPVLQGNKNYMENSFLPSPSHFSSPTTPSLDLFNNFFDM